MGRFLGASPMAGGDAARRGRRYEALPADNEEEEVATVPTTATAEAAAAAPSTGGRSNSRSALMRSDSDADGSEEAQQMGETHGEAGRDEETQLPVLQRQQQEVEQEEQQQQEEIKKANDSGAKVSTPEQSESGGEKEEESTQQEHEAREDEDVEPGMIQIRILDLNGKFFTIPCRLDWTVGQMKLKVLESTEVPVASQRLIYRGRVLEDDSCLSVYKVEDGHTIHLFVRMAPTPDPEILNAELNANGSTSGGNRADDGSGMTMVAINSDTVSSAVFPSDSARRVDPLMLDSPLGNCARRVKLWSSFLLIIYTMKVMGQFALLANDQQQRSQEEEAGGANGASEENRPMERYDDNPQYYTPDPLIGGIELLVHCFGVYVGCVGFKAAHDTDIRPIRFYCRGIVWLAILTLAEQIYTTVQISESDFSTERVQYPYGAQAPTKEDIVSANIFQTILLVVMWMIAIRHSYLHQREVAIYNQSFAAAAMNAAPPVHLPEVYSSVVCKLTRVCKDPDLLVEIRRTCLILKQIQLEAWHIANLHVLRCLDNGIDLPALDQTFFLWCCQAARENGIRQAKATTCKEATSDRKRAVKRYVDEELRETFRLYRAGRESSKGYVPPSSLVYDGSSILEIAGQMRVNAHNMIAFHFEKRLAMYVRLQLEEGSNDKAPAVAVRRLVQACYSAEGGDFAEDETLFREWLGITPYEDAIKNNLEHFVKKLHEILQKVEASQQMEPNKKGIRAFSILPFSSAYAAAHILYMRRAFAVSPFETMKITGASISKKDFDAMDHKSKAPFASRLFENQITTNGYSASVLLSRPKTALEMEINKTNKTKKPKRQTTDEDELDAEWRALPDGYEADMLVAIDPGMRSLCTAVCEGGTPLSEEALSKNRSRHVERSPRQVGSQLIHSISTKEYRHLAGMNKARFWYEDLKRREVEYADAIRSIPSYKTAIFIRTWHVCKASGNTSVS
ncbi:hypothetical protein BBJ28_00005170 [Nothophytophthora sp. Chile5]|nr:hypothetical protein BBJ28_00005170 [Nothophytophthora sp. Chile5]